MKGNKEVQYWRLLSTKIMEFLASRKQSATTESFTANYCLLHLLYISSLISYTTRASRFTNLQVYVWQSLSDVIAMTCYTILGGLGRLTFRIAQWPKHLLIYLQLHAPTISETAWFKIPLSSNGSNDFDTIWICPTLKSDPETVLSAQFSGLVLPCPSLQARSSCCCLKLFVQTYHTQHNHNAFSNISV